MVSRLTTVRRATETVRGWGGTEPSLEGLGSLAWWTDEEGWKDAARERCVCLCVCVCMCVYVWGVGWLAEKLEERSRPREKLIHRACCRNISVNTFKVRGNLWFFKIQIHFMYNFQVLFCTIMQNDAGFVYAFKPTVEHVSLMLPAF